MTTIAALKFNEKIFMAYDSQVSCGHIINNSSLKAFKRSGMLIGSCGYSRFIKILMYGFPIPKQDESTDTMTYLNTVFVDSLMEFLDKKQYNKKFDSKAETADTALICYNKDIYVMSCDYDVSNFDGEFTCVGSGGEFATGSLEATRIINESCDKINAPLMEPEHRLNIAMSAASKYDKGTGGEINILSI